VGGVGVLAADEEEQPAHAATFGHCSLVLLVIFGSNGLQSGQLGGGATFDAPARSRLIISLGFPPD